MSINHQPSPIRFPFPKAIGLEVLVLYHGIEAGALLDELIGGDFAVVVEVGTEVTVSADWENMICLNVFMMRTCNH